MMKRETFIALYNRPARVCFRYDGKRLCTTLVTIDAIENGTSQIDVVFVPPIHPHLRFDLSNISAFSIHFHFIYRRLYVSIFNLIFSSLVRQPSRNAQLRVLIN